MSQLRVLLVGASVAGPTAAFWFAKAGAKVTIIERFPALRTAGQAIDIRTAGVTVMRRMPGMEAAVRANLTSLEGIQFCRDDGKSFATMRSTGNPDQQTLVSEYEIFRGKLSKVLFDMTKDSENIKYVFGEQIASMQQSQGGDGPVTVEFANSTPTSEYDLVVACDGATSRTRAMGLGCGVRDHIKPTNCWAAYYSINKDLLMGSKLGQGFSAIGGRFLSMGPDPAGVTRVTLMALKAQDNRDATLPFREAMKQGDDALKQHVAKHFKGAGWKADELLAGMMESEDFYASEVVQVRTPSLYKGRFAMVGDAGYAPGFTGTGTSLALTGAYVLAGEIGKHKGDVAAGLRGYEEVMGPIVKEMQKVPPFVPGIMAPQTASRIWLRNTVIACVANIYGFIAWTGIVVSKCWGYLFS